MRARAALWASGALCFVACDGDHTSDMAAADAAVADTPVQNIGAHSVPARLPPIRPEVIARAPEMAGPGLTLAVGRVLLGDVAWDGTVDPIGMPWEEYSFDLDGLDSSQMDHDHCQTAGVIQQDGADGRDDSFARYVRDALGAFSLDMEPSENVSRAMAGGQLTWLLQFDNLAAKGSQRGVKGHWWRGGALDASPKWDGSDRWPRLTPASALEGHVTDDVFVSTHRVTIPVELYLSGYRVRLSVHQATVSLDLRRLRRGEADAHGVLTGVLLAEELREALRLVSLEAYRTCDPGGTAWTVGQGDYGQDIMADLSNGDRSATCDALSVGIGFVAQRARAGEERAGSEPRDPCSAGGPVVSDGALLGTCGTASASGCRQAERSAMPRPAHRSEAVECDRERPRGAVCGDYAGCSCHEDCTDGANGRCVHSYFFGCTYDDCFVDDDCGDGMVCDCTGAEGIATHRCAPADCRTDRDCPGGRWCSPSLSEMCTNVSQLVAYHCHSDADDCTTDDDCRDAGTGFSCVYYASEGRWACSDSSCTVP